MKLLITGIAGFIGSSIALEAVRNNEISSIMGIDDFSTGNTQNIDKIKTRIKFHKTSILELEKLRERFKDIDYVLHQAAIPSVPRSIKDPIGTSRVNVIGTLNVLIAARYAGVKRVILASSSSVYGDTPNLPKHENMQPCPLSPYAVSKLTNEIHARQFYELYGLETICLRYFNVFGPNQDPKSEYAAVIPKFINRILNNEKPTICGDGTQSRDFTYAKDAVNANLLAIKAPKTACGKAFNIAGGKQITINDLAKTLNKLMDKKIEPVYDKPRAGDIKHSYANISLAKEFLDYMPKYGFEEGLKETIDYFKKG